MISSWKLIGVFLLFVAGVHSQVAKSDSVIFKDGQVFHQDNARTVLTLPVDSIAADSTLNKKHFDPMKPVWMGAIFPGMGQIINKKYWKLPIIYGGFLGFAYAISWNQIQYNTYLKAYLDITDSNPSTNSFLTILPKGYTVDSPGIGGITTYTSTLKSRQDFYRRYRDLSVFLCIFYYGLTLIDAYVDAQLSDFDISPNLSMHLQPAIYSTPSCNNSKAIGLQFSFNLK